MHRNILHNTYHDLGCCLCDWPYSEYELLLYQITHARSTDDIRVTNLQYFKTCLKNIGFCHLGENCAKEFFNFIFKTKKEQGYYLFTLPRHKEISHIVAWQNSRHLSHICVYWTYVDIWRRYQWFPRQMTSKKRAQKFHTDDASLPRSG